MDSDSESDPRACHLPSCRQPESKKRCTGCHEVLYCDAKCQKADWPTHKLDCVITTAHHLTHAVYRDLLPQDQQTLSDYGFTKALTAENQSKLFGLYVGLIKFHDIKPHILHEWRIDGTLVRHIKEMYEAIPEGSRGGCYPWFLENQYVLDSSLKPPSPEDYIDTHQRRAWTFIGGSETDTGERIIAQVKTWPENKARCYELYGLLLARWHPSPEHDLWLPFGFCVTSEVSEMRLGGLYMDLIRKCTFEEFHTAFEESKLIALMDSKGFRQERLGFRDLESVLKTSPHRHFSVWTLKQLVYSEERGPGRTRFVFVDYGFMNCADEMERADLKRVYKEYFETWSLGEPLKLHEACIKGKIYEHVSGVVKRLKKDVNKYKRLMKNMYPLSDL